jgi:hypothetical protein
MNKKNLNSNNISFNSPSNILNNTINTISFNSTPNILSNQQITNNNSNNNLNNLNNKNNIDYTFVNDEPPVKKNHKKWNKYLWNII